MVVSVLAVVAHTGVWAQQGEDTEQGEAEQSEKKETDDDGDEDSFDLPDISEAFDTSASQAFEKAHPDGKRSVVRRELHATASLLGRAHKSALRGKRQRFRYRKAVVYQAAAKEAIADERFPVAMYLTLHAREVGYEVIKANAGRVETPEKRGHLDLIRRAGGVDPAEIVGYLQKAEETVPAVELLFSGEKKSQWRR